MFSLGNINTVLSKISAMKGKGIPFPLSFHCVFFRAKDGKLVICPLIKYIHFRIKNKNSEKRGKSNT